MTFDSFDFAPPLRAGIDALGYTTPTPIQAQAIGPVLQGRDVMGLAQTGTGKTAAFALPLMQRLLDRPRAGQQQPGGRRPVRVLVVAPTRELAEQIHDSFGALGAQTGLKSATVYGGVGMNPQVETLRRGGVDIVVACPGRLLDHLAQRTIDLAQLDALVPRRGRHDVRHGLPARRPAPAAAAARAAANAALLGDHAGRYQGAGERGAHRPGAGPDRPHDHGRANGRPRAVPGRAAPEDQASAELLKETSTDSVLIFTRTKHRARRIGEQIAKAGHAAASLQGNLSQNRRQAALDGFRDGTFRILVATDIAARGIDVASVSHVINYDIPNTADAYVHRIGRTGRAARTGDAFTLVSREDAPMVRTIERAIGKPIDVRTIPGFDYHAAAPARDTEFARPPMPPRGQQHPARQQRTGPPSAFPNGPRHGSGSGGSPQGSHNGNGGGNGFTRRGNGSAAAAPGGNGRRDSYR
jgi:ATP-dependent RNA helicase RhlE